MTHPIIKTDNYILITSDEEIQIGEVALSKLNQIILFIRYYDHKLYKKVIAHLPLNNSSILEGVPLLPPLPNEEDYIEKLAELNGHPESSQFYDYKEGFIDGFLEAKEIERNNLSPFKNLIALIENGLIKGNIDTHNLVNDEIEICKKYLQSLSQPKLPVGFNIEQKGLLKTKIINGVMQGQWIY